MRCRFTWYSTYYIGEEVAVKRLSIVDLLPATRYYMTYDGSTTFPACHETVTWIILNKPIYITKQQVNILVFFFIISPCRPSYSTTIDEAGPINDFYYCFSFLTLSKVKLSIDFPDKRYFRYENSI